MQFSILGKRILLWILLVSGVMTTFFTSISFWLDYEMEVAGRDSTLMQIKKTTIPTLSAAAYHLDLGQVESIARGLANVREVFYVRVSDEDGQTIIKFDQAGQDIEVPKWLKTIIFWADQWDRVSTLEDELRYRDPKGESLKVGEVSIHLSENPMRARLWSRGIYFFMSQGLKTVLVSFAIIFIVQNLVSKHIQSITSKISSFAVDKDIRFPEISLERKPQKSVDEIDVLAQRVRNMGEEIASYTSSLRHLVEGYKRSNAKLEDSHEQLVASRSPELLSSQAKSLFTSNLSHELFTPLNAVIGYSELVLESLDEKGSLEMRRDLEKIRASGLYLRNMISDLLEHSYLETNRIELYPRLFPVELLIKELESLGTLLATHFHNDFRIENRTLGGNLYMDYGRLKQIMSHLLSNAAKFCREGKITVSLDEDLKGRYLKLAVKDTGIGISEKYQKKIFDSFEQVDNSKPLNGAGVGLSICMQLARLMGGQIEVLSELGQGATFTLIVPLAKEVPSAS